MAEPSAAEDDPIPEGVSDAEVDEAIAEAGGDAREAVRALLHDVAALAADRERFVSRGYVRSRFSHLDITKLP